MENIEVTVVFDDRGNDGKFTNDATFLVHFTDDSQADIGPMIRADAIDNVAYWSSYISGSESQIVSLQSQIDATESETFVEDYVALRETEKATQQDFIDNEYIPEVAKWTEITSQIAALE